MTSSTVAAEIEHSGSKFQLTRLGGVGYGMKPRAWRKPYSSKHFIIDTVHTVFDKVLYGCPHTPMIVDEVINEGRFSRRSNVRILDCPIKFPNSEYLLPKEASQFDEVLAKMIAFEHHINPNVDQYYAYLTVDQGWVKKGELQRKGGCHVDGFQGSRIYPKRAINRSYVVYDCIPTVFYMQPFRVANMDERYVDFFDEFDHQAMKAGEVFFDPYRILLMNAYTVHKAAASKTEQYRTFVRLSYDVNKFDRLGNTHNPLFDYNWDMVVRNTPKTLSKRGGKRIVAL